MVRGKREGLTAEGRRSVEENLKNTRIVAMKGNAKSPSPLESVDVNRREQ